MIKQIMYAVVLGLGLFFLAKSLLADSLPEPEEDEDCECRTIGATAPKTTIVDVLISQCQR